MRDTWGLLVFLGAFHGINPGMGWLFAVALGMQENRSDAVWRALLSIGLGHAFAIGAVLLVGILAGIVLPLEPLRWVVAAFLVGLGILRLVRHRYPRWGSMRIGQGRLMLWSFLVATAHGAGLMVLPVWLHMSAGTGGHHAHIEAGHNLASGLVATAVHTSSYLFVTAVIAWIVFHKLGVGLLRKAWINLDVIWAATLIATGVLTAMLPAWSAFRLA
jgi:hypothetical protein